MKRNDISKKYISLAKAAKIYGCTPEHLNLMSRQGKLRAVKIGRNWLTTKKWLRDYKKFVKRTAKHEKKKTYLVSNTKAISPSQIRNIFKKIFVFGLASLIIIFVLTSPVLAKIRHKPLSIFDVSSTLLIIQETFKDIKSAYLITFKSAKDPSRLAAERVESLVFNYANFIEGTSTFAKNSFNNISRQAEEGAGEIIKLAKDFDPIVNFRLTKVNSVRPPSDQSKIYYEVDFKEAANVFEDIKYAVNVNISININEKFTSIQKEVYPDDISGRQEFKPGLLKQVGAFFVFFFESLFDSFKNTGEDTIGFAGEIDDGLSYKFEELSWKLANVNLSFPYFEIFDFSEELGGFSEKIIKPINKIGELHQKLVKTKDKE